MKRVKFIYNPKSGDGKILESLDTIIRIYQKHGYILEPYRINYEQKLECAFDEGMERFDHILVSGGDGTIDLVVNIMKKNKIDLPIGILPTGTANDFAKLLDISDNVEKALEDILTLAPKKIDLGKINDRYFINVASAGMFTDVSQRINVDFKNSLGKVSYYIKGIEEAMNLRSFPIKVTSEEINYEGDMYLMLVFNGKTAGNINLAYKAEIDDGYLDVIIFKAMPIPQSLHMLIKVIKQEHLERENEIIYFRTKKVSIECMENILVDIDGERGPDFPLTIACMEQELTILGIK